MNMPCYDPRDDVSWRDVEDCKDEQQRYYDELEAKYNKVVELLCDTCRNMESDSMFTYIDSNPELKIWWAKHKKEDQERLERERRDIESAKEAVNNAARYIVQYEQILKNDMLESDRRYFQDKIRKLQNEIVEISKRFPDVDFLKR